MFLLEDRLILKLVQPVIARNPTGSSYGSMKEAVNLHIDENNSIILSVF